MQRTCLLDAGEDEVDDRRPCALAGHAQLRRFADTTQIRHVYIPSNILLDGESSLRILLTSSIEEVTPDVLNRGHMWRLGVARCDTFPFSSWTRKLGENDMAEARSVLIIGPVHS